LDCSKDKKRNVFSGLALDGNWDGAQKIGSDAVGMEIAAQGGGGGDTKQLERWAKELERRFLPPRLQ
jgi:hypothetical protein